MKLIAKNINSEKMWDITHLVRTPIKDGEFTFTAPYLPAGSYVLIVENDFGQSNEYQFEIVPVFPPPQTPVPPKLPCVKVPGSNGDQQGVLRPKVVIGVNL